VENANRDSDVKVIILQGAGKAFCTGYDLKIFAETPRPCPVSTKRKEKKLRYKEKEERKINRKIRKQEFKLPFILE
jgi:enoyl-CoA hydratase/carnithine racemase